jgi:hypothetical protein
MDALWFLEEEERKLRDLLESNHNFLTDKQKSDLVVDSTASKEDETEVQKPV